MKQQHHVVSVYCESVKLIHEYPIHIASMYFSHRGSMVFHSIPMGLCVSASMTEATP